MITERVSNFVVLRADGLGFTLKWDTKVMNRAYQRWLILYFATATHFW